MNVLLVDDEDYVLDYLEEEIPWRTFGILSVYRASSAMEAIEIAGQVALSIVITDIRMPETSGLELLETLQKHYPETKVILLSGYSEFHYAKKALQLGAVDYLLKPVTEEEISSCLRKALANLETEERNRKNLSSAQDVLKLGLIRIREHLLLDLVLGKKYEQEELERQLHALQLPFEPDQSCVLAMIRIETGEEPASHEDFELFSYAVLNMAEEILFGQINEIPSLWTCKDSHRFILAILPLHPSEPYSVLRQQISSLKQAVETYMKRTVSVLLTPVTSFRLELHRQYLQALNVFGRVIGTSNNRLIELDDSVDEIALKPLTRLHQSPSLLQLMDAGRWEEVQGKLHSILEELDMPDYQTQQHLMEVVYYLFSSFSYIAHKQGDSFGELIGSPSFLHDPFYFHSTNRIKEWAFPIIEQFERSLQEPSSGRNHIIRQIHSFIEQHLQEDVSLTRVGEHVYLHPVYLSRLYKKETGESLSSYISRVRLEKAALLLTTTNKKVSDISLEVGYQKTQYFIRLFKEYYDVTPQVYRNRQA
ncbi:MAG TPA: response regulator [Candidatus Udaeobacter sp.]|nr:response regulator [Candidatus Udaeobacter sp.]